jgi:hypothetical protein
MILEPRFIAIIRTLVDGSFLDTQPITAELGDSAARRLTQLRE